MSRILSELSSVYDFTQSMGNNIDSYSLIIAEGSLHPQTQGFPCQYGNKIEHNLDSL